METSIKIFRRISMLMLCIGMAVILSGCNPDELYKKGKYQEAFTGYVERGGKSEVALKTWDDPGMAMKAGNEAIHDYFYAAESQKKLGNPDQAQFYYQRALEMNKLVSLVPAKDRIKNMQKRFNLLKDTMRGFHTQTYVSSTNEYPGTSQLMEERSRFEKILFSTPKDLIPEIDAITKEYQKVSKALDEYIAVAKPDSNDWDSGSRRKTNEAKVLYEKFSRIADEFSTLLVGIQPKPYPGAVTEPYIVSQAQAAIGVSPTPGKVEQGTGTDY